MTHYIENQNIGMEKQQNTANKKNYYIIVIILLFIAALVFIFSFKDYFIKNDDQHNSNQWIINTEKEYIIKEEIENIRDQKEVIDDQLLLAPWDYDEDETLNMDVDGDYLLGYKEVYFYNTDPNNPDTDGDGYLDGEEVRNGYNPLGEGILE